MDKANVVIDDIDASIEIHARADHATDVIMARHVGTGRVRGAVFLSNNLDGFVRGVLVDIGA